MDDDSSANFLTDPLLYRYMPTSFIAVVLFALVVAGRHMPVWCHALCGVTLALAVAMLGADAWCRHRFRTAVAAMDAGADESSTRKAYHAIVRVRLAAVGGVYAGGVLSLVCLTAALALT